MSTHIITEATATLSNLKRDPVGTVKSAGGAPVVIMKHSRPAFYCLSLEQYEALIEQQEDADDLEVSRARLNDEQIPVNLHDL
ncbi:MAG: type II toxin-antitoxin system Phd/YefM family antitoxin [Burkholderiales bacterium]|jgi:antitoxin StbD|nr:type II toxin-antitoxin system Phd/YefM family antitoxin [Burkholderiales bacterium]